MSHVIVAPSVDEAISPMPGEQLARERNFWKTRCRRTAPVLGISRQDRKDARLSTARGLGSRSTRYQSSAQFQVRAAFCPSTLGGGKRHSLLHLIRSGPRMLSPPAHRERVDGVIHPDTMFRWAASHRITSDFELIDVSKQHKQTRFNFCR